MRIAPPKETKTMRTGLLVLLLVISLVITTVWFREGTNGPIHKTRIMVQSVASPIGAVGEWATTPVRSFGRWVSDIGVSRSQLIALRSQNDELRARVVKLEEANLQYKRLDALLGEAANQNYSGVAASVIGLPVNSWEQVITVDKGTKAGIRVDMPVTGSRGLLGQVIEVGANYAKVRLITDQRSGVASMLQRGRKTGITKGSLTGSLTLEFVQSDVKVIAGDVILTSGLGGLYPRGLTIGEVLEVSSEANALYQSIKVLPANDLTSLEEVLILTNTSPQVEAGAGNE